MKKYLVALNLALVLIACGQPASRDKSGDGNWLYTDGRSILCQQELRARNIVPAGMPIQFYPDTANIVQVRANNPGVYSLTETEYKNLCRTVGIDLTAQVDDGTGRRDR